jgi:protein O-GlcNAc transferase
LASEAERLIAAAREAAQAGRLEEAERLCAAVAEGDESAALNLRGALAGMRGDFAAAAALFRRVLERQPGNAKAAFNLGECCRRQGDVAGALAGYARAIESDPDMLDAYRHGALAATTEAALAAAAGEDGIARYARSRAANYLNALALKLEAGDPATAEATYREAAALAPEDAVVLVNLGELLLALGRPKEAEAVLRQAIALAPSPEAQTNLGVALAALGRGEAAIDAYRAALTLEPDHLNAQSNLGGALAATGRRVEALAALRTALTLCPGHALALVQLVYQRQWLCDWPGLDEEEAALLERTRSGERVTPLPLLAFADDPALLLRAAEIWARPFAVPAERHLPPRPPARRERLRIGYLSRDFRVHAIAFLAAELFERHDRTRVEIAGYSIAPDDGSALGARLRRSFEHFTDLTGLDDAAAARRIHADGIDILVDLTGHTEGARTRILAFRPAPVQVNYLGFPGSMGADFIDYILVDPFLAPAAHQPFFSERLVHLPHCYQVNDTARTIAPRPARAACGLPERGFVFCCFNQTYKITPAMFGIWMHLLWSVPESVLWLFASEPAAAHLRREAASRGVAPERLIVAPPLPQAQHLARLSLADLFLDTLPYNAHTTASDALWVGLPVLTCAGRTFASRVAGSLVHALGLPELVTTSLGDYEAQALRLARHPRLLAALRRRLAVNRATAAPFDTSRQARHIEAAFAEMWRIHCAGDPPRSFAVTDD